MASQKYEFDKDGNLKILKEFQKKRKVQEGAKNILLISNKLIEVQREIISWDAPKECNLLIIVPPNFNMNVLARLYFKFKEKHNPLAKIKYDLKGNVFTINIISGAKRCSFCTYFQEYLDTNLLHEIVLTDNPCSEWTPDLKEKIPEDEYQNILDEIKRRRLEYFSNTTSKYREQVLKRDSYRCLSCGTDGKKPHIRKNGVPMKNPLQIHHRSYNKDSPDSLITLCAVCHYKLHRRLFSQTGHWSSKEEDMKMRKGNQ